MIGVATFCPGAAVPGKMCCRGSPAMGDEGMREAWPGMAPWSSGGVWAPWDHSGRYTEDV